MPARDLIVVGASAGGVEVLVRVLGQLPRDLPAAILVVQHVPADVPSQMAHILGRAGPLPATEAADLMPIQLGHIYVAPADFHLVVEPGHLRLLHTARENRFRPSIDPLFRSAARHYGNHAIAVLLTGGWGMDGAAGLLAVRTAGGIAIVQDPKDALFPSMPRSGIEIAGADFITSIAEMPALLKRLVRETVAETGSPVMPDPIEKMPETVDHDMSAQEHDQRQGASSVYSCPECGGVLWQVQQRELIRFRCHVGHSYYAEQLLDEQAQTLEAALWTAVRIFRERTTLSRQLALREHDRGNTAMAVRYEEQAAQAEGHGQAILQHLLNAETGIFPPANHESP